MDVLKERSGICQAKKTETARAIPMATAGRLTVNSR